MSRKENAREARERGRESGKQGRERRACNDYSSWWQAQKGEGEGEKRESGEKRAVSFQSLSKLKSVVFAEWEKTQNLGD